MDLHLAQTSLAPECLGFSASLIRSLFLLNPLLTDSCVTHVTYVGTSTLKNCILDILYPHNNYFICRHSHWYSALNKATGTSFSGALQYA